MNNYLSNWGTWIGQIADDVTHQIDGSLQNVEHIVRAAVNGNGSGGGPGLASGASGPGNTFIHGFSTSRVTTDDENSDQQRRNTARYSMGNGGVSGSSSPTSQHCRTAMDEEPKPAKTGSSRICDHCSSKFNLFNRKKICSECRDSFCSNCVTTSGVGSSRSGRCLCVCCNILMKRPLVRSDLMALRVKDLQKHLVRKKINSKSCVEKKDLVELIIRESGGGAPFTSSAPTSPTSAPPPPGERVVPGSRRGVAPVERQTSFPKSYVDSSHRHDWFEKLDRARERPEAELEPSADAADPEAVEDEVVELRQDSLSDPEPTETPVEPLDPAATTEDAEAEEATAATAAAANTAPTETAPESVDGAVGGSFRPPMSEPRLIPPDTGSLSAASSPSRRFARQGLVRLNEIETEEDLNQLSAKQIKDLLAMNRVNFHGVIEKEELLKIVERLWRQEKKTQQEKDNMEDTDLCKICWDGAVDCVMLECGHMATCINCGKQLAECPICRQYIVRVVKIFKA